jgi:hypothetical protein
MIHQCKRMLKYNVITIGNHSYKSDRSNSDNEFLMWNFIFVKGHPHQSNNEVRS